MKPLWIYIAALISNTSLATSFDCAKATSSVERLICQDAELGRLDDELTVGYKRAMAEMAENAPLVVDQKQWLKDKRNQCREVSCLKQAYRLRIDELRTWNDEVASDQDIFGHYRIQRDNFIYNSEKQKEEFLKTEDCLSLSPAGKDTVKFFFFLVGGNAHTCEMEGVAKSTGTNYEYKQSHGGGAESPMDCVLRIRVKRNSIALHDATGACRQYSCGIRAGINGTEFGRKQKTNKKCAQ